MAGEGHSISVKLSALHPRYEVAQYDRCVPALIEQFEALMIDLLPIHEQVSDLEGVVMRPVHVDAPGGGLSKH